ncbi:olfactory receptor 1-like [Thunnus maccoyii]|uniref:olfactory receptor 1-like n=1 Tax=Thunnus maccoyii TaxID=8240 RepID=UPI001C4BD190|nr:olfactory receptor 1-like [Thunnus maccoyii]
MTLTVQLTLVHCILDLSSEVSLVTATFTKQLKCVILYYYIFFFLHLGKQISIMSPEEKAATIFNATFVRPAKFYISGFSNIPHVEYYYVFLCFVYIMTVLGNVLLLSVIYLVETLHTPKYMIVSNLAVTDLCGSTALIPKLLDTFLFDKRYIVYEACLSHMFFVLFFGSVQSWTLVTMAYDRFIAICFPLRYHSIVTKPAITAMLLFVWVFLLSLWAFIVGLFERLSFCRSLVIKSFYCDHGPVYRLACNDTSLNNIMAYFAFIIVLCIPLILIGITYVCITIALSRIASGEERLKALKTCTPHLILVAILFLPILGTNIAAVASNIHPNARIINSSLTHTIPALLNPIVYSLKTEEVLNSLKKLFKKNRLSNTTSSRKVNSLSLLYCHSW